MIVVGFLKYFAICFYERVKLVRFNPYYIEANWVFWFFPIFLLTIFFTCLRSASCSV